MFIIFRKGGGREKIKRRAVSPPYARVEDRAGTESGTRTHTSFDTRF